MAKEYVFTIATRDKEHPLNQTMLIECGFRDNTPNELIEGLQNIVDMLKLMKTPEKVAQLMIDNAIFTNNKTHIKI